eukprot:5095417-Amphidinium_carterae.1
MGKPTERNRKHQSLIERCRNYTCTLQHFLHHPLDAVCANLAERADRQEHCGLHPRLGHPTQSLACEVGRLIPDGLPHSSVGVVHSLACLREGTRCKLAPGKWG